MRTTILVAWGAGLLATLITARAGASYPAGVWAKTDRITMLPNETSATEVQIHGVFLVWSGHGPTGGAWGNEGYEAAREGYMYFSCPPRQEVTCRLAWKDLKDSIGDHCRGFGAQDEPPGTVRDDAVCPVHPDEFPMGMGVVSGYAPCAELDKFVATDAGVVACDAGPIDGDAGASRDAAPGMPKDAEADTSIDPQPEPPGSGGAGGSPPAGSGGSGTPGSGGTAGAGTAGSLATGGGSPEAASPTSDDGGCALATGHHHAVASIGALALAALASARRRRSGERRPS